MDSGFGIFGGFGRVCSLVLVVEPGFRRVQISVRSLTCQVQRSSKFVSFGFDPKLVRFLLLLCLLGTIFLELTVILVSNYLSLF